MRFVTADELQKAPPVKVELKVDVDGDVEFLVNGIKIAYLDHSDGELIIWTLSLNEQAKLREAGFGLNGGTVKVDL